MKRPNFFLIGAPKCGTTALSEYLRKHPSLFFSSPKEPHFFNEDFANRHTTSLSDYVRHFEKATDSHKAIGEGSVFYLSSRVAVSNILSFQPNALFIVMLRNTIDMAHSWHSQALYSFGEDEPDFEQAWSLQASRKRGLNIPTRCPEPKTLLYGDLCALGVQLARLYNRVPHNRVKVIFFEDLVDDTKGVYESTLAFLGLKSDGQTEFPKLNANKSFRSLWLERATRYSSNYWSQKKREFNLPIRLRVANRIRKANSKTVPRRPLAKDFREELQYFFRDDVETLQELTGRDLTHWGMP